MGDPGDRVAGLRVAVRAAFDLVTGMGGEGVVRFGQGCEDARVQGERTPASRTASTLPSAAGRSSGETPATQSG